MFTFNYELIFGEGLLYGKVSGFYFLPTSGPVRDIFPQDNRKMPAAQHVCAGAACSEVFSGPRLAQVLRPALEHQRRLVPNREGFLEKEVCHTNGPENSEEHVFGFCLK